MFTLSTSGHYGLLLSVQIRDVLGLNLDGLEFQCRVP
jgi:hypothetical protein